MERAGSQRTSSNYSNRRMARAPLVPYFSPLAGFRERCRRSSLILGIEVMTTMKHKKLKFVIAAALAFLAGFLSTVRSAPAQQPERFDL